MIDPHLTGFRRVILNNAPLGDLVAIQRWVNARYARSTVANAFVVQMNSIALVLSGESWRVENRTCGGQAAADTYSDHGG
jgi:hypothetical protein